MRYGTVIHKQWAINSIIQCYVTELLKISVNIVSDLNTNSCFLYCRDTVGLHWFKESDLYMWSNTGFEKFERNNFDCKIHIHTYVSISTLNTRGQK